MPTVVNPPATGMELVWVQMTQAGDHYVLGAEVRLSDVNPPRFDCSEFEEWGHYQIGYRGLPDGASAQHAFARQHGRRISQAEAARTPGAQGYARHPGGGWHVVTSRGDGTTIEARGRAYGVGVFPIAGRDFNMGWYLLDLIDYGWRPEKSPARVNLPTPVAAPGENRLDLVARALDDARRTNIGRGSRGNAVEFLRAGLRLAGYWSAPGDYFDGQTELFVRHLQRHHGLVETGTVGQQEWFVLTILARWPLMK